MQRGQGPFMGCVRCPMKCLFRTDVNALLSPRSRQWIEDELNSEEYENEEKRREAVADAATNLTRSWQSDDQEGDMEERVPAVSYCAILHTLSKMGYSEYEQRKMSEPIGDILFEIK